MISSNLSARAYMANTFLGYVVTSCPKAEHFHGLLSSRIELCEGLCINATHAFTQSTNTLGYYLQRIFQQIHDIFTQVVPHSRYTYRLCCSDRRTYLGILVDLFLRETLRVKKSLSEVFYSQYVRGILIPPVVEYPIQEVAVALVARMTFCIKIFPVFRYHQTIKYCFLRVI